MPLNRCVIFVSICSNLTIIVSLSMPISSVPSSCQFPLRVSSSLTCLALQVVLHFMAILPICPYVFFEWRTLRFAPILSVPCNNEHLLRPEPTTFFWLLVVRSRKLSAITLPALFSFLEVFVFPCEYLKQPFDNFILWCSLSLLQFASDIIYLG